MVVEDTKFRNSLRLKSEQISQSIRLLAAQYQSIKSSDCGISEASLCGPAASKLELQQLE